MGRFIWAIIPVIWAVASSFVIGDDGNKSTGKTTATKGERGRNLRVMTLFADMRNGQYKDWQFPAVNWADIPALLELADSTTAVRTFPRNPLSSQLEPQCTEGMVALWLIEGIRQGGKFPSLNALCFQQGVRGKDWSKASAQNHTEIAKVYRAWWRKVESLGRQKAAEVDPLKGTGFSWY